MHAKLYSLANNNNPALWAPLLSLSMEVWLEKYQHGTIDWHEVHSAEGQFCFTETLLATGWTHHSKQKKLATTGSECGQRWFIYLWWGVKEDNQRILSDSWGFNLNHNMFYVCPGNYFGSWSLSFGENKSTYEKKREKPSCTEMHVNPTWSI